MQYRKIAGEIPPMSRIICGTDIRPMREGKDVFALLDCALENGVNAFDTAAAYGGSESSLGRWIAERKIRKKIILITKGANPGADGLPRMTPKEIRRDLEQSLERLQTDYIDIYLLHRDDPRTPVGEVAELLTGYLRRGVIRMAGSSNWSFGRVRGLNAFAAEHGLEPFRAVSPSFSLADCVGDPWGGSVTLSGPENEAERSWLEQTGMPVLAYSGLARGFLSGKVKSSDRDRLAGLIGPGAVEYGAPVNFERLRRAEKLAEEKHAAVPQIALAWLLSRKLNVFPICAASSEEHLRSNLASLDLSLTPEEAAWLHCDAPDPEREAHRDSSGD